MKTAALALDIPVEQPESSAGLHEVIRQGEFDVGVVVAFGRILSEEVLAATRMGYLNLHFSLLPRWRGAAPVERAIMAGDTATGVTIIQIDAGLDTGPVLTAQLVDILEGETGGALTTRLAGLGASLISRALPPFVDGSLVPVAQTDEGMTYAPKITKADRAIQVELGVHDAIRRIRALAPSPAATILVDGEPFKVLSATPSQMQVETGEWAAIGGAPVVGLGDGALSLGLIQPPGRSPVSAADWLRGARREAGTVG